MEETEEIKRYIYTQAVNDRKNFSFFFFFFLLFFFFPMKLSHTNLYSGLEAKIQKVAEAE